MLGLMVLLALGVYLAVSAAVVWLSARWARKHNRRGWVWGGVAAFAMYNLVFWDWIPTVATHQYYCAKDAGFWVYKTPEQWVKENPGVMETLSMSHLPDQYRVNSNDSHSGGSIYKLPDNTALSPRYDAVNNLMFVEFQASDGSSGYQLNERIRQIQQMKEPMSLSVRRHSETLVDVETNEVLARYVDFRRGTPNPLGGGGPDLEDLKFWLSKDHCASGKKSYGDFLLFKGVFLGEKQ